MHQRRLSIHCIMLMYSCMSSRQLTVIGLDISSFGLPLQCLEHGSFKEISWFKAVCERFINRWREGKDSKLLLSVCSYRSCIASIGKGCLTIPGHFSFGLLNIQCNICDVYNSQISTVVALPDHRFLL